MEKNTKKLQPKYPFTGVGIAVGPFVGMIIGLLFIDGDVALGMGIGFFLGSILDILKGKIVYALVGIVLGVGAGSIGGLILGLIHGAYEAAIQHSSAGPSFGWPFKNGYVVLGAVIVGAIGLAVGTIVGARKLHLENETNA